MTAMAPPAAGPKPQAAGAPPVKERGRGRPALNKGLKEQQKAVTFQQQLEEDEAQEYLDEATRANFLKKSVSVPLPKSSGSGVLGRSYVIGENGLYERIIRKRKRKSTDQLKTLMREFERNPDWSKEQLLEVSRKTGLSEAQVYKWGWDQKRKKFGPEAVANMLPFDRMMGSSGDTAFTSGAGLGMDIIDEESSSGSDEEIEEEIIHEFPELQHT